MNEQIKNANTTDSQGGILIVNKRSGMTSHDVVWKVRKLFGTRQVGHAGTLDPMAEGVLVVLIGRAAKACEYISSDRKCYTAGLKLGIVTDTEDTTGTILEEHKFGDNIKVIDIENAISSFSGKIKQIPPMYSALKVGGKKLCDLARKGITVDREARDIEIFSITHKMKESIYDWSLDVSCSGGTYIRTLCADIGQKLHVGGVMSSLVRTEACGFSIDKAVTLDELDVMTAEERFTLLHPVEDLFSDLDEVRLEPFYEKLCSNGCEIYEDKIGVSYEVGTRLKIMDKDGQFFALGEVRDYDGRLAIKAIKFFILK